MPDVGGVDMQTAGGRPNYLRPNTMTYPTGARVLTYGYGDSGATDGTSAKVSYQINRADRLTFAGTRVTFFGYTGSGRWRIPGRPAPLSPCYYGIQFW
jgi:hypothetical protein